MIGDILRGALDVLDQSWTVRALEKVNATLAAEVTHLRAQRDQLQRDCTRFQQEGRDARERARKAEQELYEIHAPTMVEPRWTWIEYPAGEYMFARFDEYGDPVDGQPVMRLCRRGDQWCMASDSGDTPLFALGWMDMSSAAAYLTSLWASMGGLPLGDTVDLGVFAKWTRPIVEAPPAIKDVPAEPEKPVVRWSAGPMHNQWRLLDGGDVLGLSWRETVLGEYRGRAYLNGYTWINVAGDSAKGCAEEVVRVLSRSGLLEGIAVDRSVFDEVSP